MTKYELPTMTFPYKITTRLALMSLPRRQVEDQGDGMPARSATGVRKSALRGHITERVNDVAYPYVRRLLQLRQMYKDRFPQERLEHIDRMIELANATMYSKLSNSAIIIRKPGAGENMKSMKKKKAWSETDWRKHMDYISQIANPKRIKEPTPIQRGPHKPLQEMLPRILELSQVAPFKVFKRISKEEWYRDPLKINPKALQYVISDHIKKLAQPKASPAAN